MLRTEFPEEGKLKKNTSIKYHGQPEIYVEGVCLRRINRGLNNKMENLN